MSEPLPKGQGTKKPPWTETGATNMYHVRWVLRRCYLRERDKLLLTALLVQVQRGKKKK